jgi:hypothetical protein
MEGRELSPVAADPPGPQPEEDLRRAYLRVADPIGTPARRAVLAVGLLLIALYARLHLGGVYGIVVLVLVPVVAAVYAGLSMRVRFLAARGTAAGVRGRFLAKAGSTLERAPALPVRVLLWGGLGVWAWTSVFTGLPFLLGTDAAMTLFAGAAGVLLGAGALFEWRVEVPWLRRTLPAVAAPPSPPPVGKP